MWHREGIRHFQKQMKSARTRMGILGCNPSRDRWCFFIICFLTEMWMLRRSIMQSHQRTQRNGWPIYGFGIRCLRGDKWLCMDFVFVVNMRDVDVDWGVKSFTSWMLYSCCVFFLSLLEHLSVERTKYSLILSIWWHDPETKLMKSLPLLFNKLFSL